MAQATVPAETKTTPAEHDAPIVLDLGKKSRKQIRRLRKGRGNLMDRVTDVIADLKAEGTIDAAAQPVIIVVRQRAKKSIFGF